MRCPACLPVLVMTSSPSPDKIHTQPEISVIIPVYNSELYLKECLDSLLGQTFGDWEAICINDGSTDGSAEILADYAARDPRIHVFSQENRGLVASRNKGIEIARGEYVFPLDSDDMIEATCLEKLYAARRLGDVVYPLTRYTGIRHGVMRYVKPTKLSMSRSNLLSASALFRKSDWERYGGYDPIMAKGLEDWEFWMNFIGDGKRFYCVQEALFIYRIRDNSMTAETRMASCELISAMRRKHPFIRRYRAFSSFLRFFYTYQEKESGEVCVRLFRVPVFRRRANEKRKKRIDAVQHKMLVPSSEK